MTLTETMMIEREVDGCRVYDTAARMLANRKTMGTVARYALHDGNGWRTVASTLTEALVIARRRLGTPNIAYAKIPAETGLFQHRTNRDRAAPEINGDAETQDASRRLDDEHPFTARPGLAQDFQNVGD